MKTATLRDLRNDFGKLEAWLQEGESIEIRRRNRLVGVLSRPPADVKSRGFELPDFAGRRKELFAGKKLTKDQLAKIEAHEMEGQEG